MDRTDCTEIMDMMAFVAPLHSPFRLFLFLLGKTPPCRRGAAHLASAEEQHLHPSTASSKESEERGRITHQSKDSIMHIQVVDTQLKDSIMHIQVVDSDISLCYRYRYDEVYEHNVYY